MAQDDDQRGAAWLATISALIVVSSFVASKAARDAILLGHFDVKTLPIFIAISAVVSLPIILIAGNLMTRYGPARLMPSLYTVSAGLAVGEWLLLPRFPGPIAVIVFFHFATSGAVLVSGFWSIVNERFDVQSAKRHIGRIGIGATLGGIFGGVLAERTAVHLSPDKILLVIAAVQLVSALMLVLFGRTQKRQPPANSQAGTWDGFRVVTRSKLLRNVGAIVVLGAVAAGIMDYVFKADIVGGRSKDELLRSLAIFYTVTNVATSVVQIVLCGPLLARLGVPRSVATLPVTITAFGAFALALPIPLAAAIARGAEFVTRNSLYRAGYELLYAPLPEEHKRPTKVVLDVGADRLGDVLGAQLVGVIVWAVVEPRVALLIATVAVGVLSVAIAMRLPRAYTQALEESLLARAPEISPEAAAPADEPQPWVTLNGLPSLGQAGDCAPLSLRFRQRQRKKPRRLRRRKGAAMTEAAAPMPAAVEAVAPPGSLPGSPPGSPSGVPSGSAETSASPASDSLSLPASASASMSMPSASQEHDNLLDAIADLRSRDPDRVRRTLAAGLEPELAPHAIDLLGEDDIAAEALAALAAVAPRCTGLLVDALLDQEREVTVRRRLPAVLLTGEPTLAGWGLWRALLDPSFDVRYRSGAVLARLAASGKLGPIAADDVYGIVRRELVGDHGALDTHRILDDLVAAAHQRSEDDAILQRAGTGLEHVFTLLGLALPAEPLRIALHAVQTDDAELRGTALEYLESILPPDVRAQLWPLLENEPGAAPAAPVEFTEPAIRAIAPVALPGLPTTRKQRSRDEIVAALRQSYPSIVEKLRRMKTA